MKYQAIEEHKPDNSNPIKVRKGETVRLGRKSDEEDLPVLYNMNFGHTEPKICLPYGALAEIDCDNTSFSILESAVL